MNVVVTCSDGSTTARNTARDTVNSSVKVWVQMLISGGLQKEA
jgi:hypothetical protein